MVERWVPVMNNIIVDFRMDDEIRNKLKKMGFEVYDSYDQSNLYDGLRGHVDLSIFSDGRTIICSKESYNYYKDLIIKKSGNKYNLVQAKGDLKAVYPGDVGLNLAFTGKYAIGRLASLDPILIEIIKSSKNVEFINVNQGYANCSICQVSDKAIITGDDGIYKALSLHGLEVLKIRQGYISLKGMDYGFIGGASCDLANGLIAFFGDLESHPDSDLIKKFVEKHGKKTISLGSGKLVDYGSGLVF